VTGEPDPHSAPTSTSLSDREPSPDEAEPVSEARPSRVRSVIEWVVVIVGALIVALLIKTFLIQAFFIPSSSMVPTLHIDDRVLVNKLSYKLHDVHRGDIVVFERPAHEGATITTEGGNGAREEDDVKDLIKRVIGLPGDEVVIKENAVWINGERLDESYLPPGTTTTNRGDWQDCTDQQPCEIPDDSVWVMGDNRGSSADSRYFGPVEENDIVGRAFLRIWPLGDFGFL
jgi:signal peptidase I